jgi:hypothetical protein
LISGRFDYEVPLSDLVLRDNARQLIKADSTALEIELGPYTTSLAAERVALIHAFSSRRCSIAWQVNRPWR